MNGNHQTAMQTTKKLHSASLLLLLGTLSFGFMPFGIDALEDEQGHDQKRAMQHATGTFDVNVAPLALDGPVEEATLARMSIVKEFHGDLEGTGSGQMLAVGTAVADSRAYVAMERVEAVLAGRRGTFALMHRGLQVRGAPEMSVTIVPDSGTGELVGLEGTLEIRVEDIGRDRLVGGF
jgi:hypothetical protein